MKVFINENIIPLPGIWEAASQQEFEENLETICYSLHCLNYFGVSEILFNKVGLQILLEHLNLLNVSNDYFLQNKIDNFRQAIIDSQANDWSENKKHRNDYNYIVQLACGTNHYNANNTSLAEASEFSLEDQPIVILNFLSSEFNNHNTIYVNRINVNPPNDTVLIKLDSITNKSETISYYLKNREPIGYKHHDKHGEEHDNIIIKNGEIVSPLKCTQEEASKLLKVAIGGKKTNKLFAFDFKRSEFIEFKCDNTVNPKGYHGYHPHDQKIPEDIAKFLNENKEIFEKLNGLL